MQKIENVKSRENTLANLVQSDYIWCKRLRKIARNINQGYKQKQTVFANASGQKNPEVFHANS